MRTLGIGNTGSKLATMLDVNALLFSTAEQDTNNFISRNNVIVVSNEGASKRFKAGAKIWEDNYERLQSELSHIENEYIVIFTALGGGSGSSSLQPISKILLQNNNKVLIVGVLPFKKEVNPPLANAVQAVNSLMPIIDKVSVMLFDNQKLMKQFEGNWTDINKHIIRAVDYLLHIVSKYDAGMYSPVTIDQSELNSVVFGGGFIDFSDTFLEESNPKFEYGKLDKSTKNVLIAMFVDIRARRETVDEYHNKLTQVINKFGTKTPNARIIPGILRGSVQSTNAEDPSVLDRFYFTIASGLSIDKYLQKISKLRDEAMKRAEAFSQKEKNEKILGSKDSKALDI